MLRLWFFFVGSAISLNVLAVSDVRNSNDYNRLERFPSSYIVQYRQLDTRDYRLILGGLEKVNGVLQAEEERRIAGKLTEISYRIPENRSAEEAFEYFYSQIVAQGGSALFRCSGRDCGSSNQWANNIFGYFRLYGVDNSQSFASMELNGDYISLYSVMRGNKRVYLRLDVLESSSSDSKEEQPGNEWPGREIVSEQQVEELLSWLDKHPQQAIWIVAYDFNSGTKQQQLDRSRQQAAQFKNRLAAAGVAENIIFLHAAGSFAGGAQAQQGTKLMVYSENRPE